LVDAPAGKSRVTIALVAASFAVVTSLALTLRSVHAHVLQDLVHTHISQGDALATAGRLDEAVVQYRAALQLERDDPTAGRSLALTLLRLGRFGESESYLQDLLRLDPTDGVLNRGLARIHAAHGREAEARAAFQRAIYGHWPDAAIGERIATRFELLEYLTRIGAHAEVLPELLRLRAELPAGRTAETRRTAELLAQYGATELALEMLAAAATANPRDVDLLVQLGQQQLNAGQISAARATLQRAVAIDGRDDLRSQLAVVDRILLLDPTLPRLGIVARTRRARLLLQAVLARTESCGGNSAQMRTLRQGAARGIRRSADAERAERELARAGEIWRAATTCHGEDVESRAITEVLERVAAVDPQR
jgi:tetratricopeptide (TPR) repeat protein